MTSGTATVPFRFADITREQRRTLLAAALGWALDSFDVMLYAMVLTHVMRDLGMTKGTAGLLNTLTLLASGTGGILFGFIADRIAAARRQFLWQDWLFGFGELYGWRTDARHGSDNFGRRSQPQQRLQLFGRADFSNGTARRPVRRLASESRKAQKAKLDQG